MPPHRIDTAADARDGNDIAFVALKTTTASRYRGRRWQWCLEKLYGLTGLRYIEGHGLKAAYFYLTCKL